VEGEKPRHRGTSRFRRAKNEIAAERERGSKSLSCKYCGLVSLFSPRKTMAWRKMLLEEEKVSRRRRRRWRRASEMKSGNFGSERGMPCGNSIYARARAYYAIMIELNRKHTHDDSVDDSFFARSSHDEGEKSSC
jgi:hypothetical protein